MGETQMPTQSSISGFFTDVTAKLYRIVGKPLIEQAAREIGDELQGGDTVSDETKVHRFYSKLLSLCDEDKQRQIEKMMYFEQMMQIIKRIKGVTTQNTNDAILKAITPDTPVEDFLWLVLRQLKLLVEKRTWRRINNYIKKNDYDCNAMMKLAHNNQLLREITLMDGVGEDRIKTATSQAITLETAPEHKLSQILSTLSSAKLVDEATWKRINCYLSEQGYADTPSEESDDDLDSSTGVFSQHQRVFYRADTEENRCGHWVTVTEVHNNSMYTVKRNDGKLITTRPRFLNLRDTTRPLVNQSSATEAPPLKRQRKK